jgi:hypothetical protein
MKQLAEAGVERYNHNLETSRRYYPEIVTTHTYDDRIATVNAAKKAGLGLCTGGIFGIKAAVDDINAAGGVSVGNAKMKITLTIVDDQSDQNKGGPLAENLVTQGKVNFLMSGEEPPTMRPAMTTSAFMTR